ncbi:MAG: PaaI family thioesterase [candidate division Zixibacteria bacterium]|nr:PaaI family thioesterase [candidate division Zixibacteria bacterium]
MELIRRYSNCFVCGNLNDYGLKVDFFYDKGIARAEYVAGEKFQGYKDILHGGIISALLDEVMIKAVIARGILVVTAEIQVKFIKPVKIGEKLFLEGKITGEQKKIFTAEGTVSNSKGEIVAAGKGRFFKVTEEMRMVLEKSLE